MVNAAVASLEDHVSKQQHETVMAAANLLVEAIKDTRPECKCPYCYGKGCKFCFGSGYVSKSRLALVPKELKGYV